MTWQKLQPPPQWGQGPPSSRVTGGFSDALHMLLSMQEMTATGHWPMARSRGAIATIADGDDGASGGGYLFGGVAEDCIGCQTVGDAFTVPLADLWHFNAKNWLTTTAGGDLTASWNYQGPSDGSYCGTAPKAYQDSHAPGMQYWPSARYGHAAWAAGGSVHGNGGRLVIFGGVGYSIDVSGGNSAAVCSALVDMWLFSPGSGAIAADSQTGFLGGSFSLIKEVAMPPPTPVLLGPRGAATSWGNAAQTSAQSLLYQCSNDDRGTTACLAGISTISELWPVSTPGHAPWANSSQCARHNLPPGVSADTVSPRPTVVAMGSVDSSECWILLPYQLAGGQLMGVAMQSPPQAGSGGLDSAQKPSFSLASKQQCAAQPVIAGTNHDDVDATQTGAAMALWQIDDDAARWRLSDGIAVSDSDGDVWVWRETPMGAVDDSL